MDTTCPKCAFAPVTGPECPRCGVVLARYRPRQVALPQNDLLEPRPPAWRRGFRVLRWVSLGLTLTALVLIALPAPAPDVPVGPGAAERADLKVREFAGDLGSGRGATLRLDRGELNGWLGANLALRHPPPDPPVQTSAPAPSLTPAGSPAAAPDLPTVEEVRSSVTDVKIDLVADRVLAWVAFELYGKALSLELEGRLRTVDGHLWLEPSRGKLGSLPLPEATLQSAARRVFDSAENREKFRLPPEVADVRVEEGVLIVTASSRSAP